IAQAAEIDAKDKYGYTPLLFAAKSNKTQIVETLLDAKADINAQDTLEKNSALHHGVILKNQTMVTMLVERGARNDLVNTNGFTPVKVAKGNSVLLTILQK